MQIKKTFQPLVIFKKSFLQWQRNALAVISIYSLTILSAYALKFYSFISRELYIHTGEWAASAFSTAMYAAVFFLNSFITLVVAHYFLRGDKKRVSFDIAFQGARETITPYFKALLFYLSIMFLLGGLGLFFFIAGRAHFGPQAAGGVNMPALLTTSTATVVLWIAFFWYGFFFSLAPLISVFENTGMAAALSASKSLIKKCPWRYLAVFLIFLGLYFFVGVILYTIAAAFSGGKYILLGWIDPVMMVLWAPLWIGLWVYSYQGLRAVAEN